MAYHVAHPSPETNTALVQYNAKVAAAVAEINFSSNASLAGMRV